MTPNFIVFNHVKYHLKLISMIFIGLLIHVVLKLERVFQKIKGKDSYYAAQHSLAITNGKWNAKKSPHLFCLTKYPAHLVPLMGSAATISLSFHIHTSLRKRKYNEIQSQTFLWVLAAMMRSTISIPAGKPECRCWTQTLLQLQRGWIASQCSLLLALSLCCQQHVPAIPIWCSLRT